ncbi:glutamate racemase [Lacticaseibacillus yichunensis]|uniref:Multifunctional fusion protein n=1 Tax=Lacticaseibacillus yichunensis TaxID=2486015 RepID=A0ABW4CLA7_9LACO|nr:glutamate racemase [Lacticaseibacillus yichunensis]
MNTQPIGFIDSGVGGLTVVKEALRQLPGENIIFLGDQARLPYGPRDPKQVRAFTWQMVNFLLTKQIKMLVVACNTATAAALPELRANLAIPVIGVIVPGSRAAIRETKNGRIGVIGTEGTVKSEAYATTIHQKAAQMQVTSLAAPKFVPLVESNEMQSAVAKRVVAETLQPLGALGLDTLVLGCTHYPLLRPLIQQVMGPDVTLIDSGAETVSEVSTLLDYFDIANDQPNPTPQRDFYTTGNADMFDVIASEWLGLHIAATRVAITDQPTTHAAAVTPTTIVVASKNPGKVKEIAAMFAKLGVQVKSLNDFPPLPTVAESGRTFEENARLKADGYAKMLELPVLADDSGLCVEALDGAPGVFSARYAGRGHNDAANNAKLIADLAEVPQEKRQARFVSTLVLARPNDAARDLVVEGHIDGQIIGVPAGANGFGYDPYFFVPSIGKTLAELTADEKNQISHRGNALRALESRWQDWFKEDVQ